MAETLNLDLFVRRFAIKHHNRYWFRSLRLFVQVGIKTLDINQWKCVESFKLNNTVKIVWTEITSLYKLILIICYLLLYYLLPSESTTPLMLRSCYATGLDTAQFWADWKFVVGHTELDIVGRVMCRIKDRKPKKLNVKQAQKSKLQKMLAVCEQARF